MIVTFVRSTWEFFHSILGDSAFAKLLAGVLTLLSPFALIAVIGLAGMFLLPLGKKHEEFRRSGKAYALEMGVRRFFRRIMGR